MVQAETRSNTESSISQFLSSYEMQQGKGKLSERKSSLLRERMLFCNLRGSDPGQSSNIRQAGHGAHHLGTSSFMSTTRSLYQMSTVVGHGSAPSAAARLKAAIAMFCTGALLLISAKRLMITGVKREESSQWTGFDSLTAAPAVALLCTR